MNNDMANDNKTLGEAVTLQVISVYALTASSIIALRMFQGENPEDWHLVVRVIDTDTGRQIKEGTLPDEEWRLKPEDWEE